MVRTGDRGAALRIFGFMSASQAAFPVLVMARVLGVSKAGFYAWQQRPPSARAQGDAVLLQRIRTIHATSRQTYGARRVHAELRAQGARHSCKRIARLMREAGLAGASRRRLGPPPPAASARAARPLTWCSATSGPMARTGSLGRRGARCSAVGSAEGLWVSDITFVPTKAGFLYLAVVLDAWSRRIVGWAMANHPRAELVLDALEMALVRIGVIAALECSSQSPASAVLRRPIESAMDAAVTVMNEPALDRSAGMQRLLQGIEHKAGLGRT